MLFITKMELIKVALIYFLVVCVKGYPHHHVYHRIHVPTRIKTIYHTKIIKVPEHHHYIHEKEKIIPEHHHYIHEKDKLIKVDPWNNLKEEDFGSFSSKPQPTHKTKLNTFKLNEEEEDPDLDYYKDQDFYKEQEDYKGFEDNDAYYLKSPSQQIVRKRIAPKSRPRPRPKHHKRRKFH